jgi:hypothetical protein
MIKLRSDGNEEIPVGDGSPSLSRREKFSRPHQCRWESVSSHPRPVRGLNPCGPLSSSERPIKSVTVSNSKSKISSQKILPVPICASSNTIFPTCWLPKKETELVLISQNTRKLSHELSKFPSTILPPSSDKVHSSIWNLFSNIMHSGNKKILFT